MGLRVKESGKREMDWFFESKIERHLIGYSGVEQRREFWAGDAHSVITSICMVFSQEMDRFSEEELDL
jgi:hypothetical protein